MKNFIRLCCIILAMSFLLSIPVSAQSNVGTRESAFFAAHATHLSKTAENRFKIWFDVTATGIMQKLGVSKIAVDRSSNGTTWEEIATYEMVYYPAMTASNTASHTSYITYYGATPGYYYRAYVTFYAKNSSGTGKLNRYTAVIQM